MNYRHLLLAFVVLFLTACKSKQPATISADTDLTTAYIGTYTRTEGHVDGKAEGIYRVKIDPRTGAISDTEAVSGTINPSFVVLSKNKRYLYAVSELAHADEPTGFIHSFRVEADGSLAELNKLPTGGQAPCHVEIDKTGKFLAVANYVGGAFSVYSIEADGSLQPGIGMRYTEKLTEGKPSWLHSSNFSPDNKTIALVDKGADRVWMLTLSEQDDKELRLDSKAQMAVHFDDGDGPRHAEWSADGRFLYVINELSNTVTVVEHDKQADRFAIIQKITTLPAAFEGNSYCADLHLHPNGKFLYGSNRGHNSIAMYAVNQQSGRLTGLGFESTRGEYPRNFSIDPRGNFLHAANQNSSNITTYRIGTDGTLTFTGQDYKIKTPVCIEY